MVAVEVLLPEHRRCCVTCGGAVARARGGRPGRLRGTCPWCRAPFDLTPHLHAGALLPGRRARWRVSGPLARGGHAWLHAAVDPATGREGVLSRVRSAHGPEAGHLAAEEPEVLLALEHPGLVRVVDVIDGVGEADGDVGDPSRHLVLEPVPGGAVGAAGPLGPAAAARVVLDAVPALAHLHGHGLLHADLTPDHLRRDAAGRVVLIDVGSVRRIADRTSPVWTTEGYVAPEISPTGAGPSTASDVFALGRTLAALVAGPGSVRAGRPRPADVLPSATDEDPARRPDLPALAAALGRLAQGGPDAVEPAVRGAPPDGSAPGRRDDVPASHRPRRRPARRAHGPHDARGAT